MDIFCKRFIAKCCCLGLLMATGFASADDFPNNPGIELDGDSVENNQVGLPNDDWNTHWNGGTNDVLGGAFVSSFIVPDTDMYVFRQGSKDVRDIDQWHFEVGSSPPKNNIEHAACSAYNVAGELVVYCMANREVTNGTATTAFWLFGNNIEADPATGDFDGVHAEGDIYVAVDHDQGGKIGEVAVFEWMSGNLVEIARSQNLLETPGTFCVDVDGNDVHDLCATTNENTPSLPWDNPQAQQPGSFLEIGANLSEISPSLTCVSSAMATDRASTSIQAQTKNFLLFPFNVCGIEVTKSCTSPVLLNSTTLQYTIEGKVTNIGFGAVSNVTLSDNPAITAGTAFGAYACDSGLPTGAKLQDFPLASLAANASVCYRATFDTTSNAPSDTVTVSASTGSVNVTDSATANCPPFTPTTGISVSKACDTSLTIGASNVSINVDFDGNVTNLSDVPLTNVKVFESHDPLDTTAALVIANGTEIAPTSTNLAKSGVAGDISPYSGSYTPTSVGVAIPGQDPTDPECALFTDVVVAVGTLPAILGGGTINSGIPVSAMCKLCPDGTCPVPEPEE